MNKVIIIDSSALFANAMEMLIENTFHRQVMAKLTFEDNLSTMFKNASPDIALVAFDNEEEEQVEKIHELMEHFPETTFIALCNRKNSQHHSFVKKHGFKGFINKLNFIKDFRATLDSFELMPA